MTSFRVILRVILFIFFLILLIFYRHNRFFIKTKEAAYLLDYFDISNKYAVSRIRGAYGIRTSTAIF